MSRKPDFLIIGAQKCGTSWLHHQLRQATSVFMPADKDYEHFSYVGNLNQDAFDGYCERFREAREEQLAGDANAAYFWTRTGSRWGRQPDSFNPAIPASVREFCGPELKLILLLRHPVERAVSAYLHHIRHGAITPEASILDPDLPLGIIDMGFYRVHLENWLAAYPRERLHVIRRLPTEDDAAIRTVEAVCRFLGVDPPGREQYYLEPIFPGFDRLVDASGVWLIDSAKYPGRRPSAYPVRVERGARYVRVVSADELSQLHAILDPHDIG